MQLTAGQRSALGVLARDLESVFGRRVTALLAYAAHHGETTLHSLAVVDAVQFKDLAACAPLVARWRRHGLAVPLLLTGEELRRTVDIFPLEYASIMADHVVVHGESPFAGVELDAGDLRRACEAQAKSHLIHLREGFLESSGSTAIATLIASSAAPFRTLLVNITRLPDTGVAAPTRSVSDASLADVAEKRIGIPASLVREVLTSTSAGHSTIADPSALLARYIAAAERVWQYVDAWKA
jgi:hypothetical protein